MRIDVASLRDRFEMAQRGKRSRHSVADRLDPSIFQYDYLTLSRLSADVRSLIAEVPGQAADAVALDLGSDKSPYQTPLVELGYVVKTLDLSAAAGADYVGTAEHTALPDASFDLVLCTQVLEHCENPWQAVGEIRRILRPGGHVIFSVPHVWFYHPHPADYWRFTQEGVVRLCEHGAFTPISLRAQGGTVLAGGQVANFLLYGVLGRFGAPMYAAVNVVAAACDRLLPNPLFCINFACLARLR